MTALRVTLANLGERFRRATLLQCFLLPAVVMLLIHAFYGVYPFGSNSVLVLDLNGQYVYFFEALRSVVHGDGSLLYDFSRSMGGEFMGIYAYYLASPLSYLVALFPEANILEALYLMFVIKCGLCGLTFGIFLRKCTPVSPRTTVLFSLCYAICGYGMIMQHNTMWIDNMYLLPLICLGIRELIVRRRFLLYTLSLSLAILSNFYIGYMMCIFVLLYFFVCYFSMTPTERNPRGLRFHFPRTLVTIGAFSAMAIMISAVITIPAYYALQFGKTTFTQTTYEFISKFDLLDFCTMFFANSYDTVRPEGLPIVYCGVLTILLVPFYLASRHYSARERFLTLFLCAVLVFGFSIKTLDLIWHGFQAPNWLNYRYSFMLCFLLCVMAAKAFDCLCDIRPRAVVMVGSATVLLLIFAQFFDLRNFDSVQQLLPSVLLLLIYIALLAYTVSPHPNRIFYGKRALAVLLACEIALMGFFNLLCLDLDVVVSSRNSFHSFNNRYRDAVTQIKASDSDFYRMEILHHGRVNDPYALQYNGLSGSTSTLNASTIAFLFNMGVSARSHWSQYCTSNPVMDSLLGLRYILDESRYDLVSDLYQTVYDNGEVVGYYNPYALPIAFAVSDLILDLSFAAPETDEEDNEIDDGRTHRDDLLSPVDKIDVLLSYMTGSEEGVDLLVNLPAAECPRKLVNVTAGYTSTHMFYRATDSTETASIIYTATGDGEHELYAFFPTDYQRTCELYIDGEYRSNWFVNHQYGYIPLGVVPDGQTVEIEFRLTEEGSYSAYIAKTADSDTSYFYYLDQAAFGELFGELGDRGIQLTEHSDTHFLGTLTTDEENPLVLTTIPFDRGWHVYVDGTEVEVTETVDALLSFRVSPGTHTVEMNYMPDCYVLAAGISLAGVVFLAGTTIIVTVWRRRHRKSL